MSAISSNARFVVVKDRFRSGGESHTILKIDKRLVLCGRINISVPQRIEICRGPSRPGPENIRVLSNLFLDALVVSNRQHSITKFIELRTLQCVLLFLTWLIVAGPSIKIATPFRPSRS